MLKSMNFLRGKSRGRVSGGTKAAPLVPVILCLVHRILWKQGIKLVNKLALLLNKCWSSMLSTFCAFFKYPSPADKSAPSPSGGEGWHCPWCDKILGTDCASRPRMTGAENGSLSFSCNRHSLSETRIMSLMRSKIFSRCTNWYIRKNLTSRKPLDEFPYYPP